MTGVVMRSPSELTTSVVKEIGEKLEDSPEIEDGPRKIVEITFRGKLGFPNSALEMDKIRREVRKLADALHVRIKNHSVPLEYGQVEDGGESKDVLERRVIERSVAQDKRYRKNLESITEAVIGSKRMALTDEPPEKIADFVASKLG